MRRAGTLIDILLAAVLGRRLYMEHPIGVLSACLADGRTLGTNAGDKVIPGFDERGRPLLLELSGKRVDIDSRLGEAGQNRLAIAPVGRENRVGFAVIGEGLERGFRHGIDRERGSERADVEDIGRFRIGNMEPKN